MSLLTQQQQDILADVGHRLAPKEAQQQIVLNDVAKLLLRGIFGGLMAGHGAQKLFGWFNGPGHKGTTQMMGMLGLEAQPWSTLAELSEFGGGALTTLGLLHPLGPIASLGSMAVATGKVHWGKPVWSASGGAEVPILYMAAFVALALTHPDRFSLDSLLGIRIPRWISLIALTGVIASVVFVFQKGSASQPEQGKVIEKANA